MLLRRITQASDFQGPAPLDDKDASEDTLRLLFGTADEVEAMRFPAALALEQPLLVFYSASPALRPTWSPFPTQNETLFVDFFVRHSTEGAGAPEYALRVQSFAPGGEFVKFQSLLPRAAKVSACTEMTLTFQETRDKVSRAFYAAFELSAPAALTRAAERRPAPAVAAIARAGCALRRPPEQLLRLLHRRVGHPQLCHSIAAAVGPSFAT